MKKFFVVIALISYKISESEGANESYCLKIQWLPSMAKYDAFSGVWKISPMSPSNKDNCGPFLIFNMFLIKIYP